MNRISSRTISILSVATLTVVLGVSGSVRAASPQGKLSKTQISSLVATAKTPAEHHRIADYYKAEAQNDLAQAGEHQAMIVGYKANPSTKHQASDITHCANLAASLKADAAKSQQLAQMHEQMAREAGTQK